MGGIITVRNYSPDPRRTPTAPPLEEEVLDGPDLRKSEVTTLEQQVAANVRGIQRLKSEIWQIEREKRKDQRKHKGDEKRKVRWNTADRPDFNSHF